MGAFGRWNIDTTRHDIELVPPVDYLALSYYARQFVAFCERLVKAGFVTREEIDSRAFAAAPTGSSPALTVDKARALIAKGVSTKRDVRIVARFHPGQHVRARTINPVGHARLPRYARGRRGIVARDRGVFVFPDANFDFHGEKPQHLYSVRFAARELWGDVSSRHDSVYLDLWDDYLEPA